MLLRQTETHTREVASRLPIIKKVRLRVALFSGLCFGLAPIATAQPSENIAQVQTHHLTRVGTQLVVGTDDGYIATYDATTGTRRWWLNTRSRNPIGSLYADNDRICWTTGSGSTVYSANEYDRQFGSIDLAHSGLVGQILRLTRFQNFIVAHTDHESRFIDLRTREVFYPEQVIPKEVWTVARQGILNTSYDKGSSMLLAIRRIGKHEVPSSPGALTDIGALSFWSFSSSGAYKYAGTYSCSVLSFRNAPGPRVRQRVGKTIIDEPFGTASIGNIAMGPGGILSLDQNEVITVPFIQDSWLPERLRTGARPQYAQVTTYCGSNAWWARGTRLYRADLADGSAEVMTPSNLNLGSIRAIAADDRGAWVARDGGVDRVSLEPEEVSPTYKRVTVEGIPESLSTLEQVLLTKALVKVNQKITPLAPNSIGAFLKYAGLPEMQISPLTQIQDADRASGIQYGDVIVDHGRQSLYVGDGMVLESVGGVAETREISPSDDMQVYRASKSTELAQPIAYSSLVPHAKPKPKPAKPGNMPPGKTLTPGELSGLPQLPLPSGNGFDSSFGPRRQPEDDGGYTGGPAMAQLLVGVNRPARSLGHSRYVKIVPNAEYDQPQTDQHRKLLSVAKSWLGTPYRWGGNTRDGVDCSGFVKNVYKELGITLPRHSQTIGRYTKGKHITDNIHFGDVVVFPNPRHVAIYIGEGKIIEAVSGGVSYGRLEDHRIAVVRRFMKA